MKTFFTNLFIYAVLALLLGLAGELLFMILGKYILIVFIGFLVLLNHHEL